MDSQQHEFMTAQEVADMTRMPIQTLYAMNVDGLTPPRYKVGRRILYKRADVVAWIESRLVPVKSA
jgi:predicted DNA-binding transcriptional regulator AlpA